VSGAKPHTREELKGTKQSGAHQIKKDTKEGIDREKRGRRSTDTAKMSVRRRISFTLF